MNFFACQDKARSKTLYLFLGFIFSVVIIILLLDVAFILLHYTNVIPDMPLDLLNIGIILVILIGCLYKYIKFSKGGPSIADLMHAKLVSRENPTPNVKQLINIVDEIAIASGIIAPQIYVLEEENGINALVAGYNPNDTVLIVTKGALVDLSRDELQGVIAHEYSHIFNSDTTLNLRMIMVLGGLFFVSQVGNILLRSKNDRVPVVILGITIYLIGLIGVLTGSILRAAISRQRESLADASAVQYTRDPNGIARALLKIEAQGKTALMKNKKAEEVNHMCFAVARDLNIFGLLASHPKLSDRIAALDPDGQIRAGFKPNKNVLKPKIQRASEQNAPDFINALVMGVIATSRIKIVQSIGNPNADSFYNAEHILESMPDEIMQMLESQSNTQALMYAIALSMGNDKDIRHYGVNLDSGMQTMLNKCIDMPEVVDMPHRFVLINLSIAMMKRQSLDIRSKFMNNMNSILEKDMNISKALLLTVLKQRFNIPIAIEF